MSLYRRARSALMCRYNVDSADDISQYSQIFFEQACVAWGLCSARDLPLLIWAAKVCKAGLVISYAQYSKYSSYLINNASLIGFSKQQKNDIALLVEGHRLSIPRYYFNY